jgi:predicted transcriptional regulator
VTWNIEQLREEYIMTSKRRSNDLIVSQILKLCVPGASKTRVIYQANLNFLMAKSYLDNLIKSECIEAIPEGSRIVYKTTSKGMDLKERFEQYHSAIGELYACV